MRCALCLLVAVACTGPPKSEGYRRIEVIATQGGNVPFVCKVGIHSWVTYEATTPWQFEIDLDTMHECICGTHCRIVKATNDSRSLRVYGFDRDSCRLYKYLPSRSDTLYFQMRSWI